MTSAGSANRIVREKGPKGFPIIRLSHSSGCEATLTEYGAHIISWKNAEGRELLFVSERANYQEGLAIRGGIPIVFPQFGKGQLPAHGFARIKEWKVVREQISESRSVSVTLRLTPDPSVLAMWPHAFVAELDVVLADVLVMTLRVVNGDVTPFSFFSAFHTYFAIDDVDQVKVLGLKGCKYVDFLRGRNEYNEDREAVMFDAPVDRAYKNSPESVSIEAPAAGLRFRVTKDGLADSVVWNPWLEGNRAINDLADGDFRKMICVEAGNVLQPVMLEPGAMHSSGQVLRVEKI